MLIYIDYLLKQANCLDYNRALCLYAKNDYALDDYTRKYFSNCAEKYHDELETIVKELNNIGAVYKVERMKDTDYGFSYCKCSPVR